MPTTSKTSPKNRTEKFPHPISSKELAALQAPKPGRTEWDAEKADAAANEFAGKLTAKMSAKELFVLWGAYYRTSGHKRLAQTAMAYFASK